MNQLKYLFAYSFVAVFLSVSAQAGADKWQGEWPDTDFSKTSVDFDKILSGGPPKDGIPSIDDPKFVELKEAQGLDPREGVVSVSLNGDVKAYPIRILMWHEIVNDTLGGIPISVTYCPLCNAALVFDRRLKDGRVLEFGTTGKLRNSDLIMYDRQTESWWQQFTGQAIVGALNKTQLKILPSRMESWSKFQERFETALVQIPNHSHLRQYGRNPYVGYSQSERPFLYPGQLPSHIAPMQSVLVIKDEAWSIPYLKKVKTLKHKGMTIEWSSGQAQAVEGSMVFHGEDIGNVVVQKDGKDVAHHLTFAFAFHAFHPKGTIYQE